MKTMTNVLPRIRTRPAVFLLLLAFLQPAAAGSLVEQLVEQLGVTEEQAAGGAGAIFDYAKRNLEPKEFSQVAEDVPGMDALLAAAPDLEESGGTLGKLGGMMGDRGGSLGALASLAGSFEALGLDSGMVEEYLPVVLDYVESTAGEQALGLLQGLF